MYHKTAFKKRLLALALAVGMLNSTIGITTCLAAATPQENAISKAVDWLNANQNGDGSWGKSDVSFIDTSEVSDYITKNNILTDNLERSKAWMETVQIPNNDVAARVLPFVKDSDRYTATKDILIKNQNEDGGWGIYSGYESDVLDTELVLNALNNDNTIEKSVLQNAVSYIISRQHQDGSWSFQDNEDPVISLTARIAITLNSFQKTSGIVSDELQTSMQKAGEYLISVQKADKTWGTDKDSITDTLLSYRAVLETEGLDFVDGVDTAIINIQDTDGSWYDSPYITALALKAIKEHADMPYAKINSIKLLKNTDGTRTECYSYNAYETFEIDVDSTYSNAEASLLYFIKQSDGSVKQVQSKGTAAWDTSNSLPGKYSVVAVIKDNKTGGILSTSEKSFDIVPTTKILDAGVSLDIDATTVGKAVNVNAQATIINASNLDKQYKIRTSVLDGTQVVSSSEKMIESKADEQTQSFDAISFSPDVSSAKDYIVKAEVFDGDTKVAEGQSTFSVKPLPPDTRIDISQSLNKDVLYPKNDSVEASFKLKGQGTIPSQNSDRTLLRALTAQQTAGYANGKMYNEFIEYTVASGSNNGRFTIGTTGGNPDNPNDNNKIMLYGHPSPWSSYTTVKVDGGLYIYNPTTQYPMPNASDLSNTSEYTVKNMSVKQIVSIVANTSTQRSDIVQIKYIVKNTDTKSHDLGLRIMMDTMLGNNDAAPFRIPGIGAVTTELELKGDNIPQYWQAFDSLTNPSVISQGTLTYDGDKKPDKVQFTNWGRAYYNAWLDSVNTGSSNGDSAVSVYWNPNVIVPGETREYVTYYGLSEFQQDLTGSLAVSLTGANNITVENNSYNPNPFTVTTYVSNTGNGTANNVKANIILPSGLKLAEGETAEKNIGSLASRQEQQVSWNVEIEPSAVDRNLSYSVTVSADGIDSKTLSRSIHIPALYDDTSGRNVVLETCIPKGEMQIDASRFSLMPAESVDNPDGSITMRWKFDRIAIGEEKLININYDGTNLTSDTTVLLTKNSRLTYEDRNGEEVTENLPDLKIPVSKYILDSKVITDKSAYTANENVNITDTVKNLAAYSASLTGRIVITDTDGNLVKVLSENENNTWDANETKSMNYIWNTGRTMSGTYKVKAVWSEGEKVISTAETSFDITADASASCTVTVDKQTYTAGENVNINGKIRNNSTNNIEKGLTVRTSIINSEDTLIWSSDNIPSELLPNGQAVINNTWNTAQNAPGKYTVIMELYRGNTKLTSSTADFEIAAQDKAEGITGISGSLQMIKNSIYPKDTAGFMYTIRNTGNVNLTGVTVRIRIADTGTGEVLGTITDTASIDIASNYTNQKEWTHETLKTGTYMVILDAQMPDGDDVPLASSYIKVEKPYETTINQVVRPRVLAWAESQCNIDLAKNTLDEMQVYYNIVNTREDFMKELRTGKYNLYMLLDSKLPLTGDDDAELANEIASGKGIIASRDADGDNLKNMGLFGVKFSGSTTPKDYTVDFSADSVFGQSMLTGTGKAQYVVLDGGQQLAVLNSKKGASPGVVINKYQKGSSLLFTFDIGSCSGDTKNILKKAVGLTAPSSEINSSYAELEIKVKANTAIEAQIKLNLPQGAEAIWILPGTEAWEFNTAAGQEYTFRVLVKLPQAAGEYPITLDSSYAIPEGMFNFETDEVKLIRLQ